MEIMDFIIVHSYLVLPLLREFCNLQLEVYTSVWYNHFDLKAIPLQFISNFSFQLNSEQI